RIHTQDSREDRRQQVSGGPHARNRSQDALSEAGRDRRADARMSQDSFDSEQQWRLIVEAAPNGMLLVDERGTIVMVNTSVLRQFGYGRDELLGKSVEMLIPGPLRSDHRLYRAGFTRTPQARSMGSGRE